MGRTMRRRTAVAAAALAVATALTAGVARAQTWPARPIRIISPFAAGGGTDYIARTVGQKLADANKWTVVIENKTGANGTLGLAEVARANPSGHDVVVGQLDNLILAPLLTGAPFDPVKDFTPIALVARTPMVLVAAANSRYRTFGDAVAASRAAPDSVTFGSSGIGSGSHLTSELLRVRAGVQLRHAPYRGSAPALSDLVGNHIDVVGSSIASAIALIRSGEVRALAVSSAERSALLPDVPTIAELGISGVDVSVWYGILGPARLPEDVRRTLSGEVNKAIQTPEAVAAFESQGLEAIPRSPESFAALVAKDHQVWTQLIAEIGIKRE